MAMKFDVIQGDGQPSGPTRAECDALAAAVIDRLTDGQSGDCTGVRDAHDKLTRLHFCLINKNQIGLLPGGWQLIYMRGRVCVRIKTVGTQRRPRDHMTISLTRGGPGWTDEMAKYNGRVQLRPAWLGENPIPNMPRIGVLQTGLTGQEQDDWANDTHFDFPADFDRSAADTLQPDAAGG